MNKEYTIEELDQNTFNNDNNMNIDIAFFCAGGSISKQYAANAVKAGTFVIDNTSAFRMHPDIPLVIPEINAHCIHSLLKDREGGIIANPNCSTILLNMAIYPLYQHSGIERLVVSTYQAASGAGLSAMNELEQQARDWLNGDTITQHVFGRQYIWNLFSHNSAIDLQTGYNEEELKIINETKKIFGDDRIKITATCVRVPVLRAHCESVNVTLSNPLTADEARQILKVSNGITVEDDRELNRFPEPMRASHQDDCFVGRIRQDLSQPNNTGLELFISGDQIRKGAALNAVQIAEYLLSNQKLKSQLA